MYKKTHIILLATGMLTMLFNVNSSAQGNEAKYAPKQEVSPQGKKESAHSLYAGLGFSNNMVYMGSNISQDKPVYSGSLTYGYKNKLFASAGVNHLAAFNQAVAFSTFTLSYLQDINSWLDISMNVSRYQVNVNLTDTLFNNFFYGSIAAGIDWKILYTNLSAGGIFSESSNLYFQLKNSRYFETPKIMNGKAYFSFDPYVNLLFGTLTRTTTADGTTIGVTPPFKINKSPSGGGGGGSSGTTSTFFSLIEANFGIPVAFNLGKLSVEADPGYILPAYSNTGTESPKGFTFFLNISYKIF
jgi:hypothetical protein